MKRTELIFNLAAIPLDGLMLTAAGIVAFYLRQRSVNFVGPILYQLQLSQYLRAEYQIIPALLLIFAFLGLYNLRGTRKFADEFPKIVIGVSLGLLIVILLFFFNHTVFPSRFIILATWVLGIFLIILGRVLLKSFQRSLFRRNVGLQKLVLIDGEQNGAEIIENVYKNKNYGYEIIKELKYSEQTLAELEKLHESGRVDEILQANPSLSDEINLKLVQFARNRGLEFSFVPNLFEVQRNSVELHNLRGIPVIALKNTPLDGWGQVAKRALDVFGSLFCLIVTSPLFLLLSLAIKFNSPGKIIYAAERGGRGKNFRFYKFRTMFSHMSVGDDYGGRQAENLRQELWSKNDRGGSDGPFLKIKRDPRVTKVGRFLRRTKLDEIPQFYNVLKGDMSMVGPRAHVLDEVGRYKNHYRRMFSIKPGIFGMSQIAQISWPDLPFEEEIRLNTYYIENWSLWLDVKILAKSFYLLFFGVKSKEDY